MCKIIYCKLLFFLTVSVSCSCLTLTCFLQGDFGRPTIDLGMHDIGNLGYEVSCTSDFQESVWETLFLDHWLESVTASTGVLGSNHSDFWKQKIFRFVGKWANKFKYSTVQPLKTFKAFELTWPLRKQPSNLWTLLVHLSKNLRIFCHQKSLWLNNLFPSVMVWLWVVAL